MKRKKLYNNKNNFMLRYVVLFFILIALCYLFPYTHDDLAWGSITGINRMKSWFSNYNGRYLGNIIVIIMTRSNFLKTVIMAVCLTGIVFVIEKMFQRKWVFYLTCLIMVLTPKQIFQQAIGWTSGFANYVTSTFLILLYIMYVYPVLSGVLPKKKYWQGFLFLILGISSTLIMENVTIYAVVIAFAVVLYTLIRFRKIIIQHLAFLLGSLAGVFYMFSNEAYHSIANGNDACNYRTMGGNIIETAMTNYKTIIVEQMCLNNVWLNIMIAVVCIILYCNFQKTITSNYHASVMRGSMYIIIFYATWSMFSSFGLTTLAKENRLEQFEAILTLFFLLSIIIFSLTIGLLCNCTWKIIFWVSSILCLVLPLLAVTPIGPRCFFSTYIMFALLFMELCCQIPSVVEKQIFHVQIFKQTCLVISLVGMAFYFIIFSSVMQADRNRLEHIRKEIANGKTNVEIIHLPYESYLWCATPTSDMRKDRYKQFYNLPKEVVLTDVWNYSNSKQ